jgi:hypothetical protein
MSGPGPWRHNENIDYWNDAHQCSFCSSLRPSKLFELLEKGVGLEPTDRNYKVYLDSPDRARVYFHHFSEDDKKKFTQLMLEKKIKIGYPGYFYTLPFFMRYDHGSTTVKD